MSRKPRIDFPGAWHHVTNRGLAKRPAFESGKDVDAFLAGVAEQVGDGRIEVHSYSILATHFHLLVRSPRGELSEGMRRIENDYVRGFNRDHHRDGPLFSGRFGSQWIGSETYWQAVLWYIDRNPIEAGIVKASTDYPHGSAWWYARGEGPEWLHRKTVEAVVSHNGGYDPAAYPSRVGGGDYAWVDELVERRLASRSSRPDILDDLVGSAPDVVQTRMIMKTLRADGTRLGRIVLTSAGALRAVEEAAVRGMVLRPEVGKRDIPAEEALATGFLRLASGLTLAETSHTLGRSVTWCLARLRAHRRAMELPGPYRERAVAALKRAIRREAGTLSLRGVIPIVPPPL